MTFKVDTNRILNTFRNGLSGLITSLIIVVILVLIKYNIIEIHLAYPERINKGIICLFVIASFICGPSVLCLFQYNNSSKGIELSLNSESRIMTIKTVEKTVNINESQLVMIKMICSFAVAQKRLNLAPTDPFYYYKIITTSGEKFIIPCLTIEKEMRDFYPDKVKVMPQFIAFISL